MSTRLNVALVAEFDLCEKLAEALEQSCLEIEKVSVVELLPKNKAFVLIIKAWHKLR